MKRDDPSASPALLVADAAGHILERIGKTWQQHARGVAFEVALSERVSAARCAMRGRDMGFLHWLDRHRAARAAAWSLCPQAATIYHYLPGEEETVRELAAASDVLTTGARSWQEKLRQLTGKEVFLTPQSIDTELYKPAADKTAQRLQAGMPAEIFVLGFVANAGANVQDRKGAALFSELVRQLRLPRSAGVLLVGQGWEVMAAELRAAGVSVWQRSCRHWQEAKEVYGLMDVLVVTAKEEGGPATVMEAMSCGIPVVTSPVGHVPEMVEDGVTGLISRLDDRAGYIGALHRLAADPSFADRLGQAARVAMVQHWDDRRVIPLIDFASMQATARVNYGRRTEKELRSRRQRFRWSLWRDRTVRLLLRR